VIQLAANKREFMQNEKYNGWTNYETWLFNLWHDDAFTDDAQSAWDDADGDEEKATDALAQVIESFADEVTTQDTPTVGFIADIINAALRQVNFREIAAHYIAEVDRDTTETNAA